MNLERYQYFSTSNNFGYEFYSVGPKGKIKKLVIFSKVQDHPFIIYNLAFGDENLKTGLLDDSIKTNNNDREKVLATVASAINDFSLKYGSHFIYVQGSTSSRTRLYQMSISNLLNEIEKDFDVYGIKDNDVHLFQKNVNYDAFFVKKK